MKTHRLLRRADETRTQKGPRRASRRRPPSGRVCASRSRETGWRQVSEWLFHLCVVKGFERLEFRSRRQSCAVGVRDLERIGRYVHRLAFENVLVKRRVEVERLR